jgi:alpha-tubulin suppressor-like RCC1 family protein
MSMSCPVDAKAPEGTACDDGDYCTDPDQCDGSGLCEGTELALLYDIVSIAAGYYHTCAVTAEGGAMCWGYNDQGMLGDGTTTDSSVPVQVSGLTSGVAVVTAGNFHTCALMDTGGVKCWGANSRGELGNGTFTATYVPVDVSGLDSGVIYLAAGTNHTCAVMSAGGIKCWGSNGYGQLGDGTTIGRNEPVDVQGLPMVAALAVGPGWWHTCSLHVGGGVWCWGRNPDGQLGNGVTTDSLVPVAVSMADVASVLTTGARHNCVTVAAGAVKCWGFNLFGQLGDSSQTNRSTPVSVTGLASAAVTVEAGTNHTCAVLDTGAFQCWGDNREGQLGDGTLVPKLVPVSVTGMSSGVSAASGGHEHSCGLMETAHVLCWGANDFGQLGDGTLNPATSPQDVVCH